MPALRINPATFRGVPFFVEAAEAAGGRKTVTHDYPFRDEAFVEDLGRRARGFQIDGYILGDDFVARDRLMAALEEFGPGTLVHPYFGTRLVAVSRYQVRHTRTEGRFSLFSIDFEETVATAFSPGVAISPLGQVGAQADAAQAASQASLLAAWRVRFPSSGAPGLLGAGATKALPSFTFTSLSGLVKSFGTHLYSALRPAIVVEQSIASFKRQVDRLVLDAATLVRSPIALAARIGEVFQRLITFPTTPRAGVDGLSLAYRFASETPRPPATTLTRQYEQVNYDAIDRFVRREVAIAAARLVVAAAVDAALTSRVAAQSSTSTGTSTSRVFDSLEDALQVRDAVLAMLDTEAAQTADDDVYAALVQLRADVVAAVPTPDLTLPRLVQYTAPITAPALVIAHRLYGDIALTDDLLARNRVTHPGFVLGGRELQVLSRE